MGVTVRLALVPLASPFSGSVSVAARCECVRPPRAVPPKVGTLIYGTPLKKPGASAALRGDFELGVVFKAGLEALGDGDIREVLWSQRKWSTARGTEVGHFQDTNERWPASTVWSRTRVVGRANIGERRVEAWSAEPDCYFTRADAEA